MLIYIFVSTVSMYIKTIDLITIELSQRQSCFYSIMHLILLLLSKIIYLICDGYSSLGK